MGRYQRSAYFSRKAEKRSDLKGEITVLLYNLDFDHTSHGGDMGYDVYRIPLQTK